MDCGGKRSYDELMSKRQIILIGLGTLLVLAGLVGKWPEPTDPTVPQTKSFFLIVGGIVGSAGVLMAIRHSK